MSWSAQAVITNCHRLSGWGKNKTKQTLFAGLEAGKSKIKAPADGVQRSPFHTQLFSLCLYIAERASELSGVYKSTNPLIPFFCSAFPLMFSLPAWSGKTQYIYLPHPVRKKKWRAMSPIPVSKQNCIYHSTHLTELPHVVTSSCKEGWEL